MDVKMKAGAEFWSKSVIMLFIYRDIDVMPFYRLTRGQIHVGFLSKVPVVYVQVTEAGLQAGERRGRVLRSHALEAAERRDGTQQLRQSFARTPLYLVRKINRRDKGEDVMCFWKLPRRSLDMGLLLTCLKKE